MPVMGKKRRLHRFLGRWMRSSERDLPEDTSPVLLLGVTRLPTSPAPARRPCSLNLNPNLPIRPSGVLMRPSSNPQPMAAASDIVNDPTPTNHASPHADPRSAMDRSIDSIGACSLDVDASAELLSDRRENPSVATLRSESLRSLAEHGEEHRLPSYLALACTVNGYSPITNYDPVRLARSRDPSPHRPESSLLSPPNLVPLPALSSMPRALPARPTMAETFIRDRVDACIEPHFHNGQKAEKCGASKEPQKSFIQQRVERLYGPGALAQGFFVTKRQKSRNSESDAHTLQPPGTPAGGKHSKSMSDKLLLDADDCRECDASMKQSASSPALPVLRHLTPEFRAQLPTFTPRRGGDATQMPKSCTLPQLRVTAPTIGKEAAAVNGHTVHRIPEHPSTMVNGRAEEAKKSADGSQGCRGGSDSVDVKDGHYFLKILENETYRLLGMAEQAELELGADAKLSEDAKGFLRAAAGKARLLVSQKMQQFRGLCTNNLNQAEGEAFPTTNEDLQGFWDMVMLQVDQVDTIFKDLEMMRANNWQEVIRKPESNQAIKNRTKMTLGPARAKCAGAEEARAKREVQRKQMLEARRKVMREAKKMQGNAVEIFVPESTTS